MPDTAIETHELGKRYTLGLRGRGYGTLREAIVEKARNPFSGRNGKATKGDQLWALRDLSLTIRSGEVVGLIGHNGAGKSTLLKILSRITEPSAGYADVTGRVGSLLEVGTGFHPELTGRENVFLNGAILGMRKAEIRARFDEIVEFAEIEQFLDTPYKHFSSGMKVRLAFSVVSRLREPILLVDEVLAVGDAAFAQKCYTRIESLLSGGQTLFLVSHSANNLRRFCKRAIYLRDGQLTADGPVDDILKQYHIDIGTHVDDLQPDVGTVG
jgi:lipopolysaccharide transport system ATP-binding protein